MDLRKLITDLNSLNPGDEATLTFFKGHTLKEIVAHVIPDETNPRVFFVCPCGTHVNEVIGFSNVNRTVKSFEIMRAKDVQLAAAFKDLIYPDNPIVDQLRASLAAGTLLDMDLLPTADPFGTLEWFGMRAAF